MDHCRRGNGGGFVGVCAVDADVERLVGDLPKECTCSLKVFSKRDAVQVFVAYLKPRRKHARCYHQVGYNKGGHAEGQEDWFPRVLQLSITTSGSYFEEVRIPGCSVESTTFFACHNSGVIELIRPSLYEDMSLFAFSRPAAETKRVL